MKYLSHIDSLRAIAVLLVVLFHLDITFFQGGFIGVDVFFVISGFLITRIIKHEYEQTGSFNFKRFYIRRLRRLIPSLFLILVLVFIISFLIFSPSDFINQAKSMVMASVALSNFHFLETSNYFDTASQFNPLLHTWSLAIEEQFYLIWPLTIFILLRIFLNKKLIPFVVIFLLALSLFYSFYTSYYGISDETLNMFTSDNEILPNISSFQFYLLPFRVFEFLIGAILVFLPIEKIKGNLSTGILNVLGLLLILAPAVYFNKSQVFLSTLNLIPCLGAALLIIAPPIKIFSPFLDNKYFRLIGNISYTWYLVHWPLIVFYKYFTNNSLGVVSQILLLVVSFGISYLIYKYYETPLRYKTYKISIKSDYNLVYLVVIFILGFNILKMDVSFNDGWLWRLDKKSLDLIAEIGVPKDFHKKNWGGAGYSYRGFIGKNNEQDKPDMFLFGDSHAGHYNYGLDSILVKKHNKVIHSTNFSALLLPEVKPTHLEFDRVKKLLDNQIKLLRENPNATFVLSHLWIGQMKRSETLNNTTNEFEAITLDTTGFKNVAKKIDKFIDLVGRANRKVVIIGETPSNYKNYVESSAQLNYVDKILRPKYFKNFFPTESTFENNKDAIAFNNYLEGYFKNTKNVLVVNPDVVFCEDNICKLQYNSEIYFSDASHLSLDGSLYFAKFFEKELLKWIH